MPAESIMDFHKIESCAKYGTNSCTHDSVVVPANTTDYPCPSDHPQSHSDTCKHSNNERCSDDSCLSIFIAMKRRRSCTAHLAKETSRAISIEICGSLFISKRMRQTPRTSEDIGMKIVKRRRVKHHIAATPYRHRFEVAKS